MKREDLTGPGFGGNKIRKLEVVLADALNKGADTLITYGGLQPNSCREVCSVSCKLGLNTVLFLIGEEPRYFEGNFLLDKIYDANIHLIKADDIKEGLAVGHKKAKKVSEYLESKGYKVYNLPLGASTPLSIVGFSVGFCEAVKQMQKAPDYMTLATGSGGTQGGMILGKNCWGWTPR